MNNSEYSEMPVRIWASRERKWYQTDHAAGDAEYVRADTISQHNIWISVHDSLPRTDQVVLACGHVMIHSRLQLESPHSSLVRLCHYEGDVYSDRDEVIEWFIPGTAFTDHRLEEVTHWRPIYTPEGIEL